MSEPRDDANPGGRPPVLDEHKRRTIVALLANGSSRRVAAWLLERRNPQEFAQRPPAEAV